MSDSVPLLSAEMAYNEVVAHSIEAREALEAIASGAAVVIPAADRVDVAKVRAVIALIRSYSCEPDDLEAHWAKELESALGKEKSGE